MVNFIDNGIYNLLFKLQSMNMTLFMRFMSYLGSATILITLTALIIIFSKNKKGAMKVAINLIVIFLLNRILKMIFRRNRPEVLKLVKETGYSFPSGHAMISIGYYGYIIYLIYKYVKNKKARNIIVALLGLLILLIGISRVYLGVHYATDIIGAYIIGLMYLYIFINKVIRERSKSIK